LRYAQDAQALAATVAAAYMGGAVAAVTTRAEIAATSGIGRQAVFGHVTHQLPPLPSQRLAGLQSCLPLTRQTAASPGGVMGGEE